MQGFMVSSCLETKDLVFLSFVHTRGSSCVLFSAFCASVLRPPAASHRQQYRTVIYTQPCTRIKLNKAEDGDAVNLTKKDMGVLL